MIRVAGFLAAAMFVVVACGDTRGPLATDPETSPGSPTAPPVVTPEPATSEPPTDTPSEPPPGSPSPIPSEAPSPTGSPDGSLDPNASPTAAPEAACTGNDGNREFFAAAAVVLDWNVYCAVLPAGWFVQAGMYRRADGGFLEITYAASGGRSLQLREGAFCSEPDGCVPAGSATGSASFDGIEGTLVAGDDGSWAVVVDAGAPLSWLAIGSGMGRDEFEAIAAALHRVSP